MIGVTSEAAPRTLHLWDHTVKRCPRCQPCGPSGRFPSLYLMVRRLGEPTVETKIGISKEPCARLRSINKWAPTLGHASLFHITLPMYDAEAAESALHQHFADVRRGDASGTEWFAVSPERVLEVYSEVVRKPWLDGYQVCIESDGVASHNPAAPYRF